MPTPVNSQLAADIDQTPEDQAASLTALDSPRNPDRAQDVASLDKARAQTFHDPLSEPEEPNLPEIDSEEVEEPSQKVSTQEAITPPSNETTPPASSSTNPLELLAQEFKAQRELQERQYQQWEQEYQRAQQAQQSQQTPRLREMPQEWHQKQAKALGFNFADPQTGLLQRRLYELGTRFMDLEADYQQQAQFLQGLVQDAQQISVREQAQQVLTQQMAQYDGLPDPVKARVYDMVDSMVQLGADPQLALGKALGMVQAIQGPSGPGQKKAKAQEVPAQTPTKPALRVLQAGATQGRGAARGNPKSPTERLERSRALVFGKRE